MKLKIILLVLVVGVAVRGAESSLVKALASKIDPLPIYNLVDTKAAALLQVLHERRLSLDHKLTDMFPLFKDQIATLHDINNECYDQTVGVNKTVNIFKESVHQIIRDFISSNPELWKQFKKNEITTRVKALIGNLKTLAKLILDCVADKAHGKVTSKFGLTSMAIYTQDEIEQKMLNPRISNQFRNDNATASNVPRAKRGLFDFVFGHSEQACQLQAQDSAERNIPAQFNWQDQGMVSRVYNQKMCESCYVFSTTSAMESQYMRFVSKTPAPHFSVQATLNCMPYGCGGGLLPDPLRRMRDYGVAWDKDDPYINAVEPCKDHPVAFKADNYCYQENMQDKDIQLLIMRNGPAAAAIDAGTRGFTFLKGGPWEQPCQRNLNHAILIVGWNEKYWIIKNSWGTGWGMDGYLYLPRNDNRCGINEMFGQPVVYKKIAASDPQPQVKSRWFW